MYTAKSAFRTLGVMQVGQECKASEDLKILRLLFFLGYMNHSTVDAVVQVESKSPALHFAL